MKQRLCIGIQQLTPAWQSVLQQTGVWFEPINYALNLKQNYSVLILNLKPAQNQVQALKKFLTAGGAIFEMKEAPLFTDKNLLSSFFVKTLINSDEDKVFRHIPFVDLHAKVLRYKDAELLDGMVHFQSHGDGTVGFLGVDVPALLMDTNYRRKRFFAPNNNFPDEIVSKISKHELVEVLTAVLKELHVRQHLPFIQKWSSPESKPVFCFRIDSDFGDKNSIDKLYKIIQKKEVAATWFLHVEAHESWLHHFHSFAGQEIALHCYKHGCSNNIKKNHLNIQKGKEVLERAGFQIEGFSAPYGIWNKAVGRAVSDYDFNYTSEFTFGYDGLPIQPDESKLPLQIPIHPICTGSLSRREYSSSEMDNYFRQIIQNKLARFEPVFLYHHPLQPGLDIVENFFQRVNNFRLTNMTFAAFAEFWKSRQKFTFEAWFNNGKIELEKVTNPEKFLQVSVNHQQFHLMKASELEIDFRKNPEYEYSMPYLPEPDTVEKLRVSNLKLLKTSLLDWKNRIRL